MDGKKDNSAIKRALKEAEEIFGQPVTFKVRDANGNLVEATEEDIVKVESGNEVSSEPKETFKLSVTADSDGSKTTFSKKRGNNVVYEESHYFSKTNEPKKPENRFEELDGSEDSREINEQEIAEREKSTEELRKKPKGLKDKPKENTDNEVFTQHQIEPTK